MLHRVLTSTLLLFALPAALLASDIPIAGRVLTAGGEPAAKAEVWLEPIPPTYERAVLRLAGRAGPDAVATTRADADGNFELAAPAAGMWKVVVSAPGMLTVERRLVPVVEATALTPVRLTPAADLEVRLVDAQGKPRPGRVGAFAVEVRDAWRPRLRLADAGEDGVARLPLGKGEKIQLEVLADGHPLAVFELFDETSVTIDVPDGVTGAVRVVDRRKRPLPEAVAFQGSALVPLAISDPEGLMALVLQDEKTPAVKVVTADRSNGTFDLDFGKAGKARDLRLDPPATLEGQVLDLSTREPVAGALVWAVRGELATTDSRGQYALDVGVYRSRSVWAAAAGYSTGYSRLAGGAGGDAPAIGLTPAAVLAGRVKDTDGAPLSGVEVELRVMPHQGRMPRAVNRVMGEGWHGRTSERGAFRVPGLPAGVGYRLTFTAEGFAPATLDVAPLTAFEHRDQLEVVLEPGRLAFGRVVDESDVPVAGAEVVLRPPPESDDPMAMMRMMRSAEAAGEPTHLTGAEGRFEIADLAAGSYDLEVRAAGFAPAKVPGVRVSERDRRTDFGTVVLIPGARIEGRVSTGDGAAVAGAEVAVDREQQGYVAMSHEGGRQGKAETDAEGRFVVADLLPDQPVSVAVRKEGFGSQQVTGVRPPTVEPLAIVLRPSGRLTGRVVDTLGDPIEGARIHASPDHRAMISAGTMRFARLRQRPTWAAAGADGRFAIEDVEPGTLQVSVDAEGFKRLERTGVELAPGAELELDFVLEEGATVEGTVTTADGEPVTEAWVNVAEQHEGRFPGAGGVMTSGQTGADGRYRVTGAPTGPATVTVHRDGGTQTTKHVEVRPGTNVVDLVLERGFEVSGQVVTQDGSPVGGAQMAMEEIVQATMGFRQSFGAPQAVSAADGTFTLTGVSAGKYKVNASSSGYAQASTEAFEVSGDVTGLVLEMGRGTTLKGRVLGLDFDQLGSLTLIAVGAGGMRHGRVDFAGEYAIEGLAPGQWHVQAQVGASGRTATLQVEISEGEPEVVRDLDLGAGFILTGIVLDAGQPLAEAHVTAASATGGNGSANTGADGRFRIEGLKAGSYQVMVMAGMSMQYMQALDLAGDQELRIEIATGSISGRVYDAAGEPLAGVALDLERLDAGDAVSMPRFGFVNQVRTDSAGRFRLARVRQGTWRVIATKSGYAPGEATVAVAAGAPAAAGEPELEIRLTPTEGVTFEAVLASGLPLQAVQVALLDASGRRIAGGHYTVADGKVRVSMVPPGRWELVVQGGDSAATRFAVHSPGDQGRLVLPAGGSLQLHVPELEAVPMASVALTGPDGKPFVSTTGVAFGHGEWLVHAGRTMVPALAPGVWSFTVKHEGRTWSGSATVAPGETTEVTVP